MKRIAMMLAVLGMVVLGAQAQAENFTQEEAKALCLKAATMVEAEGIEAARPKLHDKEGEYQKGDGELYVFVIDFEGTWLIYPPRPQGEGRSVLNVKDPDGKFLVKDMVALAQDEGEGWVEYRWMNPATNKIQPKVTFVKRIPDQDYFAAVGIYK